MSSFLIFGREPSLSFAELYQHLGENDSLITAYNPAGVVIVDQDLGEYAPAVLGGVIKSGEVIDNLDKLTAEAVARLLEQYIVPGQKFHFGLSYYGTIASGAPLTPAPLPKGEGVKRLGLEVKRLVKDKGVSVRLVESRHDPPLRRAGNLSSVDVVKNKLLDRGVELCIFRTDSGFLIGRTLAVQPFEEYSERDYGRPGRDAKRGMLPPKLGRMMVNMAAGNRGPQTVLDPFCGSGTILQEAMLLGHTVIGTDIDEDAIYDAKRNVEWLIKEYKKELPPFKVEPMDVRQLDKKLSAQSTDAVVTECDLGPPLSGRESRDEIIKIERDLSDLYVDALELIRFVLRDEGRVVLAWPYFVQHDVWVSAFDKLSELGWQRLASHPKQYESVYPLTGRNTLLYGRPDQRVWREIIMLKKSQ